MYTVTSALRCGLFKALLINASTSAPYFRDAFLYRNWKPGNQQQPEGELCNQCPCHPWCLFTLKPPPISPPRLPPANRRNSKERFYLIRDDPSFDDCLIIFLRQ